MAPSSAERIPIGKFGRAHGVRGELRLFLYNPESELVQPGLVLYTDGDDEIESVEVAGIRPGPKSAIVRLEGIDDRDAAEAFVNLEVSVARDEFPEEGDEEFYLADVLGLDVELRVGQDAEEIGSVAGFLDEVDGVMVVTGPRIDGRLLVPLTVHAVEAIDLVDEVVTLAPLEEWAPEDTALKDTDE